MPTGSTAARQAERARRTLGDLSGFLAELRLKLIYAPAEDIWRSQTRTPSHIPDVSGDFFLRRTHAALIPAPPGRTARGGASKWQQLAPLPSQLIEIIYIMHNAGNHNSSVDKTRRSVSHCAQLTLNNSLPAGTAILKVKQSLSRSQFLFTLKIWMECANAESYTYC